MAKRKKRAPPSWPTHWPIGEALKRVQAMVRAAGGGELLAGRETNPVARARQYAERLAPADMLTSAAVGHGIPPEELEAHRAAYRQITDVAHKRLSIVGLRSGDAVEVEVSDRMQDFIARFFGSPRNPAGARESNDDATD